MRIHSENATLPKVALTPSDRKLLRNILGGTPPGVGVPAKQLVAIRELCAELRPMGEREHILNALRVALVEIANEVRIPYGLDRNELLSAVVGVFADEFFARPAPTSSSHSALSSGTQRKGTDQLAAKRSPRPRINCSPTL
jgi:hypothetical protein